MFNKMKFQNLKVNQCFYFEPSFHEKKWIVRDDSIANPLNEDILKIKVNPECEVYVEQLFTIHYDGLGYVDGEAYGFTCWEDHPGELFTVPEVREFISRLEKINGFDEKKITVSLVDND